MNFLAPEASGVEVEAALAELAATGFARLGRVLSDEGIATLAARADDLMLGHVVHEGLFFQHDAASGRYEDLEHRKGWVGPSIHYRKLEKLEKDPVFRAFLGNPLFERITRALTDGSVTLYRAVLFNKAARAGTALPWHQDGGSFWGLDRAPLVQIWTALDDAPAEAGCVEIVPHSHQGGLATPLGGVIPAEVTRAAEAEARSVLVPARAGDAMLIHNDVWHRSGTNTTDKPRRAVTVCYLRGETRCMRTRRAPRTFETIFEARHPRT
ncbi:phytanoyl-CoA dioxygenase family protein [Polyangium mundeleinium]|uniref:Phytanoyl-CoA dioxygenase family protein n=1 Tax=Polyangium mundeleinium TaxID=2995306 RepID=A0ABT5EUM6_9BACT|nr:phytanoyl-CoA dioxygenase family protein [Polyangium mundeleinium]MDC0744461.1 phytanoyl-CoA dioxygenase family protein [Polyangium mundeleinium]